MSEVPTELVVVEGATLRCSLGTRTSQLRASIRPNDQLYGGRKICCARDSNLGINIAPFGDCRFHNGPCILKASGEWKPYALNLNVRTMDGHSPALVRTSLLVCAFGGLIQIQNAGQSKLRVPVKNMQEENSSNIYGRKFDNPINDYIFVIMSRGELPYRYVLLRPGESIQPENGWDIDGYVYRKEGLVKISSSWGVQRPPDDKFVEAHRKVVHTMIKDFFESNRPPFFDSDVKNDRIDENDGWF